MIEHTRRYGIYRRNIVDDIVTVGKVLVSEKDTLSESERFVEFEFKEQISSEGSDRIEIIDRDGNVKKTYNVVSCKTSENQF